MSYLDWKNKTIGRKIDIDNTGDYDCVDVPKDYAVYLFGNWTTTLGYGNAKDIYNNANPKYWQKIPNDPKDPNQLPKQGDVMVFGPTPKSGYTNTFNNPYGHTGVVDSANSSGYSIIQQSSGTGAAASVRTWAWKYRPTIGWLRPIPQAAPAQTSQTTGGSMTSDFVTKMYQYVAGRTPTVGEVLGQVQNGTPDSLMNGFIANNDLAVVRLNGQVSSLSSELTKTKADLDGKNRVVTNLQGQIDSLNTQIASLKAQVGDSTKFQTLGALLRELLGLTK